MAVQSHWSRYRRGWAIARWDGCSRESERVAVVSMIDRVAAQGGSWVVGWPGRSRSSLTGGRRCAALPTRTGVLMAFLEGEAVCKCNDSSQRMNLACAGWRIDGMLVMNDGSSYLGLSCAPHVVGSRMGKRLPGPFQIQKGRLCQQQGTPQYSLWPCTTQGSTQYTVQNIPRFLPASNIECLPLIFSKSRLPR